MYHTGYETFYLMDKIIDPGYKIHRTCAQVMYGPNCIKNNIDMFDNFNFWNYLFSEKMPNFTTEVTLIGIFLSRYLKP